MRPTLQPPKSSNGFALTRSPLRTSDPGPDLRDLAPLQPLFRDARIVALGEATHGTREFVQFSHRLTEFLVTNMGFSLFAIEGPAFVNASAVNDYVLHGRGNAVAALDAWRAPARVSKEMLDMIEWMRQYNRDPGHTRKVKFFGLDLFPIAAARSGLIDYLERVDPAFVPKAREILRELPERETGLSPALLSRVQGLRSRLHERRELYTRTAGKEAWTLAERYSVRMTQMQGRERDCYAADNIRWLLDQEGPNAKIVLYAHNGHIAGHGWEGRILSCFPMGGELRKTFGKEIVLIGSAFSEGRVRSSDHTLGGGRQSRIYTVPPAPAGTLAATLATTGLPMFVMDIRQAPAAGVVGDWFNSPVREYIMAGAVADAKQPTGNMRYRHPLRDRYDAVAFFARSSEPSPARRLALAPVPAGSKPANMDFEEGTEGWSIPPAISKLGFTFTTSVQQPNSGARCAVLTAPPPPVERSGALGQSFDAEPYRGRLVRFRASLRGSANNRAYLYLRVDRPYNPGFYGNTRTTPAVQDQWGQFEIIARVAEDAYSVHFGLALEGGGSASIDAASFETVEE